MVVEKIARSCQTCFTVTCCSVRWIPHRSIICNCWYDTHHAKNLTKCIGLYAVTVSSLSDYFGRNFNYLLYLNLSIKCFLSHLCILVFFLFLYCFTPALSVGYFLKFGFLYLHQFFWNCKILIIFAPFFLLRWKFL